MLSIDYYSDLDFVTGHNPELVTCILRECTDYGQLYICASMILKLQSGLSCQG